MKGALWLGLLLCFVLGSCKAAPETVVLGGGVDLAALKSEVVGFTAMRAAQTGSTVVIEGTVGKVCPAGCWFYLHGPEDLIYVDVLGDFKVPQEATGQVATVRGVTDGEGGSRLLKAQRVVLAPAL